MASLHNRCLEAIKTLIQGLGLSGIASTNIRWLPRIKEQQLEVAADELPLVIVAPPGKETIPGGTNERDDVGYPCVISFFAADPDIDNDMPRNLAWREDTIAALREQRLAGVEEIHRIEIVPDVIIDPAAWANNYWFSAFVARCYARQART